MKYFQSYLVGVSVWVFGFCGALCFAVARCVNDVRWQYLFDFRRRQCGLASSIGRVLPRVQHQTKRLKSRIKTPTRPGRQLGEK